MLSHDQVRLSRSHQFCWFTGPITKSTMAASAAVEVGTWGGAGAKRPRTEVSITATECGSERPSTARRAVPLPRYAGEDRRSRPSRTQ